MIGSDVPSVACILSVCHKVALVGLVENIPGYGPWAYWCSKDKDGWKDQPCACTDQKYIVEIEENDFKLEKEIV